MIWQVLLNGLVTGSIYALVALGYTLVYGVARLINFAHGDIAAVGAYVFLMALSAPTGSYGLAAGAALSACVVIALAVERLAYRPTAKSGSRLAPVISTLGASAILQASLALLFGVGSKGYPASSLAEPCAMGPVTTTAAQLLTMLLAAILTISLFLLLRYTRHGRAVRAVADDRELAETVGIRPTRVVQSTFAVSGVLAAAAGIMAGLGSAIRPGMGYTLGFSGFTAAVLGGIGNPLGAVLGAAALGVFESLAAGYLASGWKTGYAFIVLVGVLLLRPEGFLRGRRLERG